MQRHLEELWAGVVESLHGVGDVVRRGEVKTLHVQRLLHQGYISAVVLDLNININIRHHIHLVKRD